MKNQDACNSYFLSMGFLSPNSKGSPIKEHSSPLLHPTCLWFCHSSHDPSRTSLSFLNESSFADETTDSFIFQVHTIC